MKAKQTVMSWERIRMVFQEQDRKGITDNMFRLEAIAKDQAEITWDIAFKAGYEQVWKDGIIQQTFDEGKRAGMEEEAKGGTNALSYLRGVEEGEERILKIADKLVTGFRVDAHIFLQRLKEQALKERG